MMLVIAQFKFAATYLAPGAWPALMFAGSTALGAITSWLHLAIDPISGTEWPFVLNVLFWLLVLNAIAGLVYTTMRIFGRKPALNEVLSGLVTMKSFKEYQEEMRLRDVGLEKQISSVRHETDERLSQDLVRVENTFKEVFRRGDERDKIVAELGQSMSRLYERTDTHIRKFDQLDGKMDRLMERLPK